MPTLQLLDDAMLHPGRFVPAVNRLGGGQIALVAEDQPWRVVGSDAVVYQLRQPSGRVIALRCILADAIEPTLTDRYRALASHPVITQLRDTPNSPLVSGINVVPDGLTLPAAEFRSITHPVITLDWVMGPTLLAATDRACRAGDRPYLAGLAGTWLSVVETLSEYGIAHGDLTADNAMIRPDGSIALVDYDTCVWPGSPKHTNPGGSLGYRHPTGDPQPAPQRRDDFAALVIYTSLRVLAFQPDLRADYGDPPSDPGGTMLFSPWDLVDPTNSALFRSLQQVREPDVRYLIDVLMQACLAPADAVPPLREAAASARHLARTTPSNPPQPSSPSVASASSVPTDARERQSRLTRLNSLLLAGDDDAAHQYWFGSGLANDPDAARELGPRIAEIERRRAVRQARAAAEAGDSAALLRLWSTGDMDEVGAAAPLRPAVEAAERRRATVDRLRMALDDGDATSIASLWPELRGDSLASPLALRVHDTLSKAFGASTAAALKRGDDRAILAAVHEAESAGVPVSMSARRAARGAAARLETRQELEAALAADDRPALAALAVSGRLVELGKAEPHAMRAVLRAIAWPHLERALKTDEDAVILEAYNAELFDEPGALTGEQRARVELARARIAWLTAVRAALRTRDVPALKAALPKPPPGAEARLSRAERNRIHRLTSRDDAIERLAAALQSGQDTAIVEALNNVEAAGATLPAALDWVAVRGVVDRVTLMDAIRRAASATPPDYGRLARLLPAARAAGVTVAPNLGLGLDFARLELDVLRAAHLHRLRDAIAHDNDAAIVTAAFPDPYGALETLSADERKRVDRALAARRGTDRLGPQP